MDLQALEEAIDRMSAVCNTNPVDVAELRWRAQRILDLTGPEPPTREDVEHGSGAWT